ncbi:MAG: T9SS type A sorting domain-containing protein [Bacteroidota bacterium]
MSIRLLSFILFFPAVLTAHPVSLQLTTTAINLTGAANTTLSGHAHVENIGGGLIDLSVVRTQNDTMPGHNSFFCWGGACFPAATSLAPFSLPFNPGDVDTTLEAKVEPRGFAGTSTVGYCFFDASNPSDSVCVIYTYNFTAVGVEELPKSITLANAVPNPADRLTVVSYSTGNSNGRLVITDLLGSTVKEIALKDKQGALVLATAELSNGIYVYTLVADGKPVSSRRLVVSHK